MRHRVGLLLVGFVLGIAVALAGVAVTGGWYEYRSIASFDRPALREILGGANVGGWQPVAGTDDSWFQRPRIRLGW